MSEDRRWLYTVELGAGFVVVVTVASLFFKLLSWQHFEHSSLVFIGLPAVIAIAAVLLPRPGSAKGAIVRATTVALLLSAVLFGEGFVCIVMAAPLFYGVGLAIGAGLDAVSGDRHEPPTRAVCVVALALVPFSLEGVVPGLEFARNTSVTVEQIVHATPAQIEAALARRPRFDRTLPAFVRRLRFPTPGATGGEGLQVGARRTIEFLHSAHNAGHHPGVLTMEVREHTPGRVLFAMADDTSYITHWLAWQYAEVTWQEIAPGRTRVAWTLAYRRRLDPAWYFAPLERYGAGLAANYLIETLATPQAEETPQVAPHVTPQAEAAPPAATHDMSTHDAHPLAPRASANGSRGNDLVAADAPGGAR
jgi:hypothetical protein